MVSRYAEEIILGAWLSGEHTEDMDRFEPKDFPEHYEIAKPFMSGITDHYNLTKAAGVPIHTIGEITRQYSNAMYEGAVEDALTKKAIEWVENNPGKTPKEIEQAMERFVWKGEKLPQPVEDPVAMLIEEFDRRRTTPYVATGIKDLDRMLCGIRRKELTSVGARPSVGKSAFVQQVAMEVAKQGHKVLFFPLEMSAVAVTERIFMRYVDVPQHEVKNGLSNEQWQNPNTSTALEKISEMFKDGNFLIYERISDLQMMRSLIEYHKPFLVVIDQLEQMKDKRYHFQDKRSRFSHMTNELQGMAMDLDVAIWLACQVNRSADNTMPTMANLKESGSIEEDSDNVILLHRESEEKVAWQKIVLDLAKQRNGECGTVSLVFMASKYAFYGRERDD